MIEKITMIQELLNGVADSVRVYEKSKYDYGQAVPGYDIDTTDSKESIKRRILVCREELLKVSKMLEGEK